MLLQQQRNILPRFSLKRCFLINAYRAAKHCASPDRRMAQARDQMSIYAGNALSVCRFFRRYVSCAGGRHSNTAPARTVRKKHL